MSHAYANDDTWTISLYYTEPVTRWLVEHAYRLPIDRDTARRALAAVIEDDEPILEHPAIVDLTVVDWTELAAYWSAAVAEGWSHASTN